MQQVDQVDREEQRAPAPGQAFAGELCSCVGFGAMHHFLDGHVKVFVAGLKFAIAKLLKSKPIAVRYACLKVT